MSQRSRKKSSKKSQKSSEPVGSVPSVPHGRLWIRPLVLENELVRLEPLSIRHSEELCEFALNPQIWQYTTQPPFANLGDVEKWVEKVLEQVAIGSQVAFAIIDRQWGQAVGSTRLFDIRPKHKSLEIGHTWLGLPCQGTGINSAAKLALLEHAFEALQAIRVQFKTDVRNLRSRKALEKIGAREEGFLRKHMILWDGHIRDTVLYSIIDLEWPQTKARLYDLIKTHQVSGG